MALKPLQDAPGYLEDTERGLIVPVASVHVGNMTHPFDTLGQTNIRNSHRRKDTGLWLGVDQVTGIPFWPPYASGADDILMRALTTGYLANVSQVPLPITLLSAIVSKIQGMVGTWVNSVRGTETAVKKTLDIMAMADDSQFGAAEFVRNHIGALSVDNRGSIGAQVPIGTIEFDKWGEYGMEVEKLNTKGREDKYVLRMETAQFRENRGLWSIDGMFCWPTGVAEWPYWIRKYSASEKKKVWVLIHRDFGFQITQQIGPKDSNYPGFGQSGVWRFSPYAIKEMMIDRMDWEHLINQPMRGIVWVSGLDTPTQFRDQLVAFREDKESAGILMYPGVFFGGSKNDSSKITLIPWTEPPAGYTPLEWRNEVVSKLAASFHMNETHLQLKLGEGALTQSGVAESLEAETAISWMRQMVEMVWNHVAPPKVIVRTIWHSDKTRSMQVDTLDRLSRAIARLNKPNPNAPDSEEERLVFSRDEIRALITEYIGIEIPELAEDEQVVTSTRTGEDLMTKIGWGQIMHRLHKFPSLAQHLEQGTYVCEGDVVILKWHKKIALLEERGKDDQFAWVNTLDGARMLVQCSDLVLIPTGQRARDLVAQEGRGQEEDLESSRDYRDKELSRVPSHIFSRGNKAFLGKDRVPVTIVSAEGVEALIRFDWDSVSDKPRERPLSLISPPFFVPDGDPLPPPERPTGSLSDATSEIVSLWVGTSSRPSLLVSEWDEDLKLFLEEDGSLISHVFAVESRDEVADEWGPLFSTWPLDGPLSADNAIGHLLSGEIALDEWEQWMRDLIQVANQAQYLAGRGGFSQVSEEDDDIINGLVYIQWQFLAAFSALIHSGVLSEQQIAARARLYFSDTVQSFENGYAAAFDYSMKLPVVPGDCTSECCAGDRCYWAHVVDDDEILSYWVRTSGESCPTCLRRSDCPPLVFETQTGEFRDLECYI